MKVAYFTHASNLTGASRSLIDLIVSLKSKGVVPVVFLLKNGLIEQELKALQIKYYIIPYKRWCHDMRIKLSFRKRIKYFLKDIYNSLLVLKVSKILKNEEVQLIHTNNLQIGFGAQVAVFTGLPHVWHMREFMEEDHHLTFDNEKEAKLRLKQAKALIAISDVIADKFSKKFERDVVTIYNGVNIEKYNIMDKMIFMESRTKLMIVGRVVASKGQMDAVKAVNILKNKGYDICLRIIGNGIGDGEIEKIAAYIKENHLEEIVELIPFQTDLTPYSRSCDIQLVCSHSEAFGRVTIEGMLAHSLVIGADAGCTPYLINDGETGLLYKCKDSQSLAEKIEWALTHKDEARKIADVGYAEGTRFSIERTSEKVFCLYQKILEL